MFFESWQGLLRTLVVGVLAYVGLVIFLRFSGKRTLAKLDAFDLVVTVALGSTLATVTLSRDVPLAEGMLGLAVLIVLQFAVTWTSVRLPWVKRAVRSDPTLLLHRGRILEQALRAQRVTESELLAAIRSAGVASLESVEAVVLETDGSLSVVDRPSDDHSASSLSQIVASQTIQERPLEPSSRGGWQMLFCPGPPV